MLKTSGRCQCIVTTGRQATHPGGRLPRSITIKPPSLRPRNPRHHPCARMKYPQLFSHRSPPASSSAGNQPRDINQTRGLTGFAPRPTLDATSTRRRHSLHVLSRATLPAKWRTHSSNVLLLYSITMLSIAQAHVEPCPGSKPNEVPTEDLDSVLQCLSFELSVKRAELSKRQHIEGMCGSSAPAP